MGLDHNHIFGMAQGLSERAPIPPISAPMPELLPVRSARLAFNCISIVILLVLPAAVAAEYLHLYTKEAAKSTGV